MNNENTIEQLKAQRGDLYQERENTIIAIEQAKAMINELNTQINGLNTQIEEAQKSEDLKKEKK